MTLICVSDWGEIIGVCTFILFLVWGVARLKTVSSSVNCFLGTQRKVNARDRERERETERQSIIRQICGNLCDLRYQSCAFVTIIQVLVNCAERTTQRNVWILETTVSLMLLQDTHIQSGRVWACLTLLAVNVCPTLTANPATYTHLFP